MFDLMARLRGLFGRRSRALMLCALFLLSGLPVRPEEIEEQIRSMSKVEIVQAMEREQKPSGDPPGGEVEEEG